jgi:hypothetical protein
MAHVAPWYAGLPPADRAATADRLTAAVRALGPPPPLPLLVLRGCPPS